MALKIRLSRVGATHEPIYKVVVAEARSRRDGAAVEVLGTYNPRSKKQDALTLNLARAEHWLSKGALPTDTAKTLIKKARKKAEIAAANAPAAPATTEIPAFVPDAPAATPAA